MARQGQDMSYSAGEMTGQAQMKKDEFMNQASSTAQATMDKASSNARSAQDSAADIKDQAANFFQQTGEQMMNAAHGAAEAVKSTLGMDAANNPSNPSNYSSTTTTRPSDPSSRV